ncbi:MAG: TRAP transporter small permease [Rhodospirillales bacterium]|nr:TRAP transporter small permease [Rhodospirillales bacterium]
MPALARILTGIDTLSRACGYLAAVLVLGIAALILAEIFCRTALNVSLSFAWEYAAYFFAVSIFLAAAFALRTGGYVRVLLLSQSVSPRVAYWLDVAATVAGTMIAGVLAWALTAFAARSWESGSTSATIDETPLVYPQAAMAFGAALLTLQLVARAVRLLVGEPPEDEEAKRDFGTG